MRPDRRETFDDAWADLELSCSRTVLACVVLLALLAVAMSGCCAARPDPRAVEQIKAEVCAIASGAEAGCSPAVVEEWNVRAAKTCRRIDQLK